MIRVMLGLLKGGLVGAGVGFGLVRLGLGGNGIVAFAACALVGALVGVICGKAPWRAETIWTPVIKAVFGGLVGAGLCFVGRRFLPEMHFAIPDPVGAVGLHDGSFLALAVGVLYGIFVEVDDGGSADADKQDGARAKALPARK